MDSDQIIRVPLHSFPGTGLTLPAGSQVLTPRQTADPMALQRSALLLAIQERVLLAKAETCQFTDRERFRILLLLPDKTRRQTAARLTLDALLDLCEQEPGWCLEIVFGLGTHPRMQPQDIEQMLGRDRLQRLERLGSALHQQSTLCPLPLRPLTVKGPKLDEAGDGDGEGGTEVQLEVPDILWSCDMVLVAGDTDLHPYEGRGGSGGINKMIAIGIGCLSTIRITHSMEILNHHRTRPGEADNRFVKTVDHFARAIIDALMHPKGILRCAPMGISVVAGQNDQPVSFWIGNHEEERSALLHQLKVERTLELKNAIDFVIADTEPEKGTDLLAGARGLHFLCSYDDKDNRLLCRRPRRRTAVMYNPCHQLCNANGIGNTGTVLHLRALQQFAIEALNSRPEAKPATLESNSRSTDSFDRQQRLKAAVLNRWERYLKLVSKEDEIFAHLEQLLVDHGKGDAPVAAILENIDGALPNSFGAHQHVLEGTRMRLLDADADSALIFFREALEQLGFKGLGEGGQRALRLLAILGKFDQLLVATQNLSVLEFLNSGAPPRDEPEESSRSGRNHEQPMRPFELVGLRGISLLEYTPQQSLDLAMERHHELQEHGGPPPSGDPGRPLKIAFLRKPVILRRSR